LFSARLGTLAARHGPRRFMALGPALMCAGALLLARVTTGGQPWVVDLSRLSTLRPPTDFVTVLMPGLVLFGLGIMTVVSPLTTALMDSVPPARSGVASALNNALSRVGPQLAMALLFVAVTATFHTHLDSGLGALGAGRVGDHGAFAPLVPPTAPLPDAVEAAVEAASVASFRLAMLVAALLAGAGAVLNGIGIEDPQRPLSPRRPVECLPGATPPA
jgi:MFS family permease